MRPIFIILIFLLIILFIYRYLNNYKDYEIIKEDLNSIDITNNFFYIILFLLILILFYFKYSNKNYVEKKFNKKLNIKKNKIPKNNKKKLKRLKKKLTITENNLKKLNEKVKSS